MRRIILALLLLTCFAGIERPAHARAASDTLGQLLDVALSPDDLDGFYINSDTSDLTASRANVLDALLLRDMYVDDLPGFGPAELSITIGAFRSEVPLSVIQAKVPNAFADLPDAVQMQFTGSLGIGDVDLSATWLQLNTDTGVYDREYGSEFSRGHILVIVLFGGIGDTPDRGLIGRYAQMQDAKLQTPGLLPVALLASPTAASQPTPAPISAPRPPAAAPVAPTAPSCPNGFIPSPGNGGGPTMCRDGLCSHSAGRGTCSGHGGEAIRIGHSDVPLAA